MRSAITISLVEEARGGPFVYWDGLEDGCRRAAAAGFDAVELFVPSPQAVDPGELRRLLDHHGLALAAVGTGAGWVKHRLTLTDPDPAQRGKACDFVRSIIDFAAGFGAPGIIGSMQGRHSSAPGGKDTSLDLLRQSLDELAVSDVPLLYEPLNRYETNLVNTLADGIALIAPLGGRVKLLADLFHMNIEEVDIAEAITAAAPHVGHIHFVDSNRRAAGLGHIDFDPIAAALKQINYNGYLCAEALPLPDADTAATQTIAQIRCLFP